MKRKYWLAFCSLWVTLGAMAQSKPLYLDPGKTVGAPASRIFKEVTFTPLETTKKSIFGSIRQLVVTDSLFIILDADTDAIYFFSKQGRFLHKYRIKRYRIRDIQLDRSRNALLIFSINRNYNIPSVKIQEYLEPDSKKDISKYAKATWYYLDDVKKSHTEDLKNFRYAFTNPVRFNKDKFATSFIKAKRNARDTLDYQLKVINNSEVLENYFSYNKKTESIYYYAGAAQCAIIPTQNDSVLFVTRPFQYEIYTLRPGTINEDYKLVLPMGTGVPAAFFNKEFANRGQMDTYKAENPNYVSQIDNVIRFNDLLFFELKQFRGSINRYIYNAKANLIYDYNKISADSISCFLPVAGNIKAFDNEAVYISLSAKSMFNAKKGADYREPQYSSTLIDFFEQGKESDNPVIIQLKPKEDIQ